MARYFIRPRSSGWVEDEYFSPEPSQAICITVHDHDSIDTGLLDAQGDSIWRAPRGMGFVVTGEWYE